jgi:hydroxymethylbilane synthase
LIQAESIITQLRKSHPSIRLSLTKISTTGDRDKRPFGEQVGGDGVFVKELEQALLDGRIDVAVHSLKDLPTQIPQGLSLVAAPLRLDPRDVLVSRGQKLDELPAGSRIGTASPRRTVQLLAYRPDLEIATLRGNVDTRLGKVESGELDAIVLAAAGLMRLGRDGRIIEYLSTESFLPPAGQGALGIEIRQGDTETRDIVSSLNHQPSWQSVLAERTFLREVGGGCRAPIGALGTITNGVLRLEGMVANPKDDTILHATEEGSVIAPAAVGVRLAERLLGMGAREIVAEAEAG